MTNDDHFLNLDKIPDDVRRRFLPFLKGMIALHRPAILSVNLYGSSTGAGYVPKVSDINALFIFQEIDFRDFTKSLPLVKKGLQNRITAPLFLTKEYIASSIDVFPMEFLEIKENHVLLWGEDILPSLEIKGAHVRLFCEQQIKGKLIRIRQAYLELGTQQKGLASLLRESLHTLIPVFRSLLRLKGRQPPTEKAAVIQELCGAFELDSTIFLTLHQYSSKRQKITRQDIPGLLERYWVEIQKLARMVDRL